MILNGKFLTKRIRLTSGGRRACKGDSGCIRKVGVPSLPFGGLAPHGPARASWIRSSFWQERHGIHKRGGTCRLSGAKKGEEEILFRQIVVTEKGGKSCERVCGVEGCFRCHLYDFR